MSKFFIQRPIFATVLAILITLAGLVCMRILPIAQYPEIAPPTVSISAWYPGANADTLSKTVATPIEQQLSGIENLLYFNSSASSDGRLTITATFEVGTNIDNATFNVNNRVQLATPRLPDEVRRNGVTVEKRSNDFLLVIALSSPNNQFDTLYLSNYASLQIVDELKRIPGSDITIFGARDYAMRIWLQPEKMAQLGITTSDIAQAINTQNAQYAAGKIGAEPAPNGQSLVYTVTTKGRLTSVEEFGDIIIRAMGPATLRLKDVARIELGAENYDSFNTLNGKPTIGLAVLLQSGANALDVAKAVKTKMEELKTDFPNGVAYSIPYDTSRFVEASITEVSKTMIEAAIIVLLVVFIFLQTWRATLIPMIAVPISLIGTFAGLWLFGFSINTLTLFAMVLAIGIVVDDAIVVLENVERLIREEKMSPIAAAIEAMNEVSGAVIGIVMVLCAVFIPVAFLGGIAGQLYKQFAVTVTIAVILSGVIALTLTPALCGLLLKQSEQAHRSNWFFTRFNQGFEWLTQYFLKGVSWILKHSKIALLCFAFLVSLVVFLLLHIPGSFVPDEDQGYFITSVALPDGASIERTRKTAEFLRQGMQHDPAVENIFVVLGYDLLTGSAKSNSATMFLPLKPWEDRSVKAQELVGKMSTMGFMVPDGLAFAFNPPPIRGIGTTGGFEVYVQSKLDSDPQKLAVVTKDLVEALSKNPKLAGINSFFRPTVAQLQVDVDLPKALSLGVGEADIFTALQAQMGSLYINDFNKFGRTYRVQIQADAPYRSQPDDLGSLYVRSNTTQQMIPLKALITVKSVVGPELLERYNRYLAAKVFGSGQHGISSAEAIKEVEQTARQHLPEGYDIAWTGQAFQEKRTGNASIFAFGFAIIMVYLILAALYERVRLPLAVLLTVPFALLGALAFIFLRGMPNDIYFQIGLIVLIGLAAKNAILITEFAQQGLMAGKTPLEAALEAARLRFRPIVMTSLAFIFGVLPLVIASGAGSAARQSMGSGVFGGMIIATFIAPLFVPLFFTLLARPEKNTAHLPLTSNTHNDE